MEQVKQKRILDQYNQSITGIKNVSNEIFYEIFDYLDGGEVYNAFSNLNYRFQQLLRSSSFLFKLRFRETNDQQLINKYKEMIRDYKHRIISFHLCLSPRSFSSFSIDSSFDRLESISLTGIHPNTLSSCLIKLGGIPRLYSLTIDTKNGFDDLQVVYRLIFALPALKFYKFMMSEGNNRIYQTSLPMANQNQFSTIKYLDMAHSCSIDELTHIVSYTPELRHLKFLHNNDYYSNIGTILLPNLTHFSISANHLHFDDFEIFIKNMHCMLKVLHFTVRSGYKDGSYLDAARWEQLILQDLPQLKEFEFEYYQYASDDEVKISYDEHNRFTSAFWFQRQWIYEVTIDDEQFIYSISPYKKKWYEHLQPRADHSSLEPSESGQMTVMGDIFNDNVDSLVRTRDPTLILTQFYHLAVDTKTVSSEELVDVLYNLPNVISLKLPCVTLYQPSDSSEDEEDDDDDDDEDERCLAHVSKTNKITEVYLEQMNDFKELNFILGLCCYVKHLHINSLQNINIESFIREILIRITGDSNEDLCLLCLRIPTADDQLIEKLKKIIDSNGRLVDYTIKRVMDKIYLQWGYFY